jgi:antitoxin (DNA-binding transcriptional repressor) of toxin-antitoxin stability system
MKTARIERSNLEDCVRQAQEERLIVTRKGHPVALVIGIDEEQLELGKDESFWKLIEKRRRQKSLSRKELESSLNERTAVSFSESGGRRKRNEGR